MIILTLALQLLVKIIDRGLTTDLMHNLIIRLDKSSCTCRLLKLIALTVFNITSSLKKNEESLTVETYCGELEAKKLK